MIRLRAPLAKIDQVNISIAALITGIGKPAPICGQCRTYADCAVVSKLERPCSVVIAGVNLFVPGSIGHESDPGERYPFLACHCFDQVIGKLMNCVARFSRVILLQNHATRFIGRQCIKGTCSGCAADDDRRRGGVTKRQGTGELNIIFQNARRRRSLRAANRFYLDLL